MHFEGSLDDAHVMHVPLKRLPFDSMQFMQGPWAEERKMVCAPG
jgi:hypothetical protein